jgi:hypothetical protein
VRTAVGTTRESGSGDRTTLQFIVAWAEERLNDACGRGDGGRRRATELSPPQVAAVVRGAALLLGDRPLGHVTFGDLARLPALLEEGGMSPDAARSASREIGLALRGALGGTVRRSES